MDNLNKYDDEQLISVIINENELSGKAFRELYGRYSAKLNSYCLFISENSGDAEEVFQDTWLKFYYSLDSSKKVKSVVAYLYKIARNISIDKYRSKKIKLIKNFDSIDLNRFADPTNFAGFLEKDDLMAMVSMAVNSLPDIYKETFLLLWFSGLSYNEIAEVTGSTAENIRMRSYRAMDEVIKYLKPVIVELTEENK